jgi:hypothetical protein
MNIPKVFISYSHDSIEHKKWVLGLAERMRNNGIDATLDQWELLPGDDLPHFMETHLAESDFVIMVCTESYVKKANTGKGGVGYEKMIITSNLLQTIDSNKIIPIIRQQGSNETPTFLKSKIYLNFSKSKDFEFSYDELVRTIHKSPVLKKPKVGNNPFKLVSKNIETKSRDGVLELMKSIVYIFEQSTKKYVYYSHIVGISNISRIYLDILIEEAKKIGYITTDSDGDLYLTDKGKYYAIENKILK